MLKKRIVGVIVIRQGWAVQSFGYGRYLPLGRPEILAENLDRWGADEIILQCIDRSASDDLGPDFDVLKRVADRGLRTPIIFGGGIRTCADGMKSIKLGADRIFVDTLLRKDLPVVKDISRNLGAQAIVAALPLSRSNANGVCWRDYHAKTDSPLSPELIHFLEQRIISEVMVIDWKSEGYPAGFDSQLVDRLPFKGVPVIAFGGIANAVYAKQALKHENVVAIAIGNFLSYREHAIQHIKSQLLDFPVRTA